MKALTAKAFLSMMHEGTLIDVRTPAEWEKAHIPGAINLPIFSNEERVVIGTIYKQIGRQAAILKGLEMVGPKMKDLVKSAINIAPSNKIFIYCWRGGMRSSSMAWLLDLYGFDVFVLKRGYKAFRQYVLECFQQQKNILILGGKTGSGKTIILNEMKKSGEYIIDLEGLAHHKGSAFGSIGEAENCSQEHFENKLAMAWDTADPYKTTWLEDESRGIGKKIIPEGIWLQMRQSRVIDLHVPTENRISFLVEEYGKFDKTELLQAVEKIKSRLGGLSYKLVKSDIENGDLASAAELLLEYYDKSYRYGLEMRDPNSIYPLETTESDNTRIAIQLINYKNEIWAKARS